MASSSYTDAVFLFGDSITEAWGPGSFAQRMSAFYNRKLDVVNRGFSGYNTDWAIPVFEQVFATAAARKDGRAQNVRLMTIWFGANDSVLPGQFQHVPLDMYQANLSKIISLVQSRQSPYYSPDTRLIMIAPPPIVEAICFEHSKANDIQKGIPVESIKPKRHLQETEKYAKACCEVAKNEGLPVVDMYTEIIEAAKGQADDQLAPFFEDGLHLSAAGYGVLETKLTGLINANYPELNPEILTMRVPTWEDFEKKKDGPFAKLNEHNEMRGKGQL